MEHLALIRIAMSLLRQEFPLDRVLAPDHCVLDPLYAHNREAIHRLHKALLYVGELLGARVNIESMALHFAALLVHRLPYLGVGYIDLALFLLMEIFLQMHLSSIEQQTFQHVFRIILLTSI